MTKEIPPVDSQRRSSRRGRIPKLVAGLILVFALGWGVHHVFSRPMRYEIPGGFKGCSLSSLSLLPVRYVRRLPIPMVWCTTNSSTFFEMVSESGYDGMTMGN